MGIQRLIVFSVFVCILMFSINSMAVNPPNEKHIEVSLRMIGHKVLLNANDSISRVLPIKKENDHYRIQFESEFGFNPEQLVNTVNEVMSASKMATGYFMEVEHCETREVVYSYEIGDLENIDIIPCRSRDQPRSCYSLLFTLSDTRETLADKITGSSEKTRQAYYIPIILLFFLLVALYFALRKKTNRLKTDPNLIAFGQSYFDKRNGVLTIEEQRIELSSKEADLLLLLYEKSNTTVKREIILNKVWGDEGDYVGRTLDVFISKLRKKLETDKSVKIVNIRGVGYKLVIDE